MPGCQGFVVSVAFVVIPPRVWQQRGLAVFYRQIVELALAAEWRKKLPLPPRPDPQHHTSTFIGRDRALRHHINEHLVCVIHDPFETGSLVFVHARHDDNQMPIFSQFYLVAYYAVIGAWQGSRTLLLWIAGTH